MGLPSFRTLALSLMILLLAGSISAAQATSYNFSRIDYLGVVTTFTTGINNNGEIVGYYYDGDTAVGFIYDGETFIPLIYEKSGVTFSTQPWGINNNGDVVGTYFDGTYDRPFLYNESGFQTFSFTGASQNLITNDINDGGLIVGQFSDAKGGHSFYSISPYSDFTQLDYEREGHVGTDTAVNGLYNEIMVGSCYILGQLVGFGFSITGGWTDPIIYYGKGTMLSDINKDNLAVGSYFDEQGKSHGLIYKFFSSYYSELDFPGAEETWLMGINDNGQIVGYYRDVGGYHGFLATPVPPGSHVPFSSFLLLLE